MPRAATASERRERPAPADPETEEPWKAVLFNCDCHTFEEVEAVLMKATRCTLSRARQLSWEVHSKGSAVVYDGARERCEAVAEVIGSIGLKVTVRQ